MTEDQVIERIEVAIEHWFDDHPVNAERCAKAAWNEIKAIAREMNDTSKDTWIVAGEVLREPQRYEPNPRRWPVP